MSSFKNHKSLFIPVALLALLVAGALFAFGLTGTVQSGVDQRLGACI